MKYEYAMRPPGRAIVWPGRVKCERRCQAASCLCSVQMRLKCGFARERRLDSSRALWRVDLAAGYIGLLDLDGFASVPSAVCQKEQRERDGRRRCERDESKERPTRGIGRDHARAHVTEPTPDHQENRFQHAHGTPDEKEERSSDVAAAPVPLQGACRATVSRHASTE